MRCWWRPRCHLRCTCIIALCVATVVQPPPAAGWTEVAYIGGTASKAATATGPLGDTAGFTAANSKLSDAAINSLHFDIVKFEPVPASAADPITFFDFSGLAWASATPRPPTPYALTEADALAGKWTSDPCREFQICNFGRAHCTATCKSSYGWKEYGGCGNGPTIGGGANSELSVDRHFTAFPVLPCSQSCLKL